MKDFDHLYILKGHEPVLTHDILEWGKWMEKSATERSRTVARDETKKGTLSTVFLAVSFTKELFETCWFPNKGYSRVLDRYLTWKEAEEGHCKYLKKVMKGTSATGKKAQKSSK